MNWSEYATCDGVELAKLIAKGAVTASEVAQAAIAAIDRLNPILNAVVIKDFEAASLGAGQAALNSRLAGVPFLLKDGNVYSERMPTTFASRYFRTARPRSDSTIVRRWRQAGLVILGKTNLPEFASDFVTEPAAWGTTINPWNAGVTVGGSSGGAGAAVASGMVPIAHGTDLGGSIRIPASCCGVFGFKPTIGLNPIGPYWHEIASGLNSDHVLTRSVRDSAASLDLTAGADESSRYPIARSVKSYLQALDEKLPALRIGVTVSDAEGTEAGPEQCRAVEETLAALKSLGHKVVAYTFPEASRIGPWFDLLWMIDVAYLVDERSVELGRSPSEDELEPLTHHALRTCKSLSASEYSGAKHRMNEVAVALVRSMDDLDVLLMPTLAADPLPVEAMNQSDRPFDFDRWRSIGYGFAPFSAPFNASGQPAASCPVRVTENGVPIGVQVVAKSGRDDVLLGLCRQLEGEFGWLERLRGLQLRFQ